MGPQRTLNGVQALTGAGFARCDLQRALQLARAVPSQLQGVCSLCLLSVLWKASVMLWVTRHALASFAQHGIGVATQIILVLARKVRQKWSATCPRSWRLGGSLHR